jgi:transcription antitermination factor NusG
MESDNRHWFALYTKPRNEFKAAAQLDKLNVLNYLPVYESLRKWSDRQKKIIEPVLKGYVFIYADEKERLSSLKQSTIVRCLSEKGRPAKIPDWQINNLKILLSSSTRIVVREGVYTGDEVQILEGPFKGIIGKIISGENEKMIAVCIDLLNRSVITHLPIDSRLKIVDRSIS